MPDAINTGGRREGAKILTSPCHNSGCGLSRFLDGVATRLFVEAGLQFAHHFFQLSEDGGVLVELLVHLPPALARGTPVHKHVLFPRVAMEVTEQEYLFGQDFSDVAHDTLGVVDGRMEDGVGSAPPPVQVVTRQPAPAYQKQALFLRTFSITLFFWSQMILSLSTSPTLRQMPPNITNIITRTDQLLSVSSVAKSARERSKNLEFFEKACLDTCGNR